MVLVRSRQFTKGGTEARARHLRRTRVVCNFLQSFRIDKLIPQLGFGKTARTGADSRDAEIPLTDFEAYKDSITNLCSSWSTLRRHQLGEDLQQQLIDSLQSLTAQYGSCIIEELSNSRNQQRRVAPEARAAAVDNLTQLLWRTCRDDRGACLLLPDRLEFLRQARPFLTAAEQIALYEQTPHTIHLTGEELYDAALAHVAEGYRQRKPGLIETADQLLVASIQAVWQTTSGSGKAGPYATLEGNCLLGRAACATLQARFDRAAKLMKLSGKNTSRVQNAAWGVEAATELYLVAEQWLNDEVLPRFPELQGFSASLDLWVKDASCNPLLSKVPGRPSGGYRHFPRPRGSVGVGHAAAGGLLLGFALASVVAAAWSRGSPLSHLVPWASARTSTLLEVAPGSIKALLNFEASFAQVEASVENPECTTPAAAQEPAPVPVQAAVGQLVEADQTLPVGLDVKAAENLLRRWTMMRAVAWNHPEAPTWLQQVCEGELLQQTVDAIQQDHSNSVHRTIMPKMVQVQSVHAITAARDTVLVWASVKELQRTVTDKDGAAAANAGGGFVHEYTLHCYVKQRHDGWKIGSAKVLQQTTTPMQSLASL